MDDELLTLETSWPATTIDGKPGIVSGTLTVSKAAGQSEFLLNLAVGPAGGPPEAFDYVEFPLSPDHAQALRDTLHNS